MARPQSRAAPASDAERRSRASEPLPVSGRPTTGLRADGATSLTAVGVVAPMTGGPASSAGVAVARGLPVDTGLTGVLVGPAVNTGVDVEAGVDVDVAIGSGVIVGGRNGVGVAVFGGTGVSGAVVAGVGVAVTVAPCTGVCVAVAADVAGGVGDGSGVPELEGTSVGVIVAVTVGRGVAVGGWPSVCGGGGCWRGGGRACRRPEGGPWRASPGALADVEIVPTNVYVRIIYKLDTIQEDVLK